MTTIDYTSVDYTDADSIRAAFSNAIDMPAGEYFVWGNWHSMNENYLRDDNFGNYTRSVIVSETDETDDFARSLPYEATATFNQISAKRRLSLPSNEYGFDLALLHPADLTDDERKFVAGFRDYSENYFTWDSPFHVIYLTASDVAEIRAQEASTGKPIFAMSPYLDSFDFVENLAVDDQLVVLTGKSAPLTVLARTYVENGVTWSI